MMMGMLKAGGLDLLVDDERAPDDHNPRGYFEYQPVKSLRRGTPAPWLAQAQGKGLKVVTRLLFELPPEQSYDVIFMRRPVAEILASQRQMMHSAGRTVDDEEDARLAQIFSDHLAEVDAWIADRDNLRSLNVTYGEVIEQPRVQAERVCGFLGLPLEPEKMVTAVDAELYRQRL